MLRPDRGLAEPYRCTGLSLIPRVTSSRSDGLPSAVVLPIRMANTEISVFSLSLSDGSFTQTYWEQQQVHTHTLHLSRPPTHSQRSTVDSSIAQRETHLLSLDVQVAAAHAAVLAAQGRHRALLSQRAVLKAQIARDRNRLQPALYIPMEILAEIFSYCVDKDIRAMWKISSVCTDWRIAALAYPRLWTKMVVPLNVTSAEQLRIMRMWMNRTRRVDGLEITYRGVEKAITYTATFEEIMRLLGSQLIRWKSFVLETNLEDYLHICLKYCVGPAPLLERFIVRECDYPSARRNRRLLPCKTLLMGPAQRLRNVALYSSAWHTAVYLRGLRNLTLVAGRARLMVHLWAVLDECPELETLTLRLPVDMENDPPGRSRGAPLRLERLAFMSGNAMILALLPHLLVPQLSVLEVNDVDAFFLMRTLNVLDLRSNPPLHTLRLRNCRLFSGTTGLSLKSIKRLEFHDSEVDDQFFMSLSMPTAGTSSWIRSYRTWTLPSLEEVVLKRAHYVREDALRRLVEARNPTAPNAMCPGGVPAVGLPARVKLVDVQDCRRVRPVFAEWIRERLGRVSERFALGEPVKIRGGPGVSPAPIDLGPPQAMPGEDEEMDGEVDEDEVEIHIQTSEDDA